MGIFDFLRAPDINQGVEEWKNTENAVLLDVRTREEYREGHIPGSLNIPLQEIEAVAQSIDDKKTPVFVHCLSGGRSGAAAAQMERMGYQNVKNIGGISQYTGKVEV